MITLTETAARRVQQQLERRGRGLGITIGVKTTGCSGLAYTLEYVDELPSDGGYMSFNSHDVLIIINEKDLAYLDGMTMEWRRKGLQEGFEFNNPNSKSECGCGESFQI